MTRLGTDAEGVGGLCACALAFAGMDLQHRAAERLEQLCVELGQHCGDAEHDDLRGNKSTHEHEVGVAHDER